MRLNLRGMKYLIPSLSRSPWIRTTFLFSKFEKNFKPNFWTTRKRMMEGERWSVNQLPTEFSPSFMAERAKKGEERKKKNI